MGKIEPVAHRIKRKQMIKKDGLKLKVALKNEDSSSNGATKTANCEEKSERKKISQIKKHRKNITEILLSSNATPIRRHAGRGYMCCFCEDQYHLPADLKKHTIDAHDNISEAYFIKKLSMFQYVIKLDITSLHCKICKRNINTLEGLMDHLRKEHKKTIHTDINNHIIPFKFDTENLKCFICMNVFDKFKVLLEHMNIHYRNYICDVCDASFVNHGGLFYHTTTHKTGSFTCDYCPKVFDTTVKKRLHVRTRHTHTDVLYKCVYCTQTFNDYRKKEAHLSSVHGMRMLSSKCQACDKVFRNRKLLGVHVKRDHLMDRPHECSECDMKFFSQKELKDHLVKHSGIRSHQCTVCLKSFGRKKTLKEHMRIHEDDRRFKCEHCGQAFVQKCSWRGHMRSKHGEIV